MKNYSNDNTVRLRDRILLSPVTKYVLSSLIVGMVLSTGVYLVMILILNDIDESWPSSCDIKPIYRVECLAGQKSDYEACFMAGCCWSDETNNCFHSIPSKHGYYYAGDNITSIPEGLVLRPRREFSSTGRKNWPSLYFHSTVVDSEYLQINLQTRKLQKKSRDDIELHMNDVEPKLSVLINSPEFSITILRDYLNLTKTVLLTTSLGPLIVTDNYWEWTIYMANVTLYGLDSTNINETTNWLYNNAKNSKIPAFFGITHNGEAFAWYVLYSGPMEVQILGDSNFIILRGMSLPDEISFRIFSSTTPQQTIKRLFKSLENDGMIVKMNSSVSASIIRSSLGLHVCPERKYIETSIVESINVTIKNTIKEHVPWDSHCIYRQFYSTLDTVLNKSEMELLIESKKIVEEAGKYLVPHLTPMILAENNILLSKLENKSLVLKKSLTYFGSYGGIKVAYPEWSDNKTHGEFENYIANYVNTFGTSKLIFIRDAWPRDDSTNISSDFSQFDYMPQELRELMSKGTIPLDLTSGAVTLHYTAHNAFADAFHAFIQQNANPLPSKEILLDNINDKMGDMIGWSTLRATINRAIGSGLVGQLPPAIYVCSNSPNMTDELCTRWYGAAVVLPYAMTIPEYLPGGAWINIGTSKYANKLLKLRASLITYQYTVMEEYYNSGQPVLAPIQFHYPLDPPINPAYNINQFFWGQSLLVGLITLPNTRQLNMRIPGNSSWRHLEGGAEVQPSLNMESIWISATEGEIVLLVRPGHVIPVHENVLTTSVGTVQSGIELLVNFACHKDSVNCLAQGKIGYGGGIFLKIIVNETAVTLENILNVKSRACVTLPHQSSLIKCLTFLGKKPSCQLMLDINLCDSVIDAIVKKLNCVLNEHEH